MNASLPTHLSGTRAAGLAEPHPVAQFEPGTYRNFVYLVLDWERRAAAIIDPHSGPGPGLAPVFSELRAKGFTLERILLTHTHWDHIDGLEETLGAWPGLEIFVHPRDAHRLAKKKLDGARMKKISDGDRISAGSLAVEVLHTPGHSAGECCFLLNATGFAPVLFTGDTVFIRDCGRTDLESGSSREMFESIQRIKRLSPETILLPGHHYAPECATTLERELRESPPFLCLSAEELEALP